MSGKSFFIYHFTCTASRSFRWRSLNREYSSVVAIVHGLSGFKKDSVRPSLPGTRLPARGLGVLLCTGGERCCQDSNAQTPEYHSGLRLLSRRSPCVVKITVTRALICAPLQLNLVAQLQRRTRKYLRMHQSVQPLHDVLEERQCSSSKDISSILSHGGHSHRTISTGRERVVLFYGIKSD